MGRYGFRKSFCRDYGYIPADGEFEQLWIGYEFDPLLGITLEELAWCMKLQSGFVCIFPEGFDVGPHFKKNGYTATLWSEYQPVPEKPWTDWSTRYPFDHRPRR